MQHVGGDDDVELLPVETLERQIALDVERAILDEREIGELLACPAEEVGDTSVKV
jgi:hypothetical protein